MTESSPPPNSLARFAELCDALAATRSRLEKRRRIAEYLPPLDDSDAALAVHYLVGRPFAESDRRTIGVGGSLLSSALKQVTGATDADLAKAYRRHGDLGAAAHDLYRASSVPSRNAASGARGLTQDSARPVLRTDSSSVGRGLTLSDSANTFNALAETTKRNIRTPLITHLLARATPIEAKYLIKIMLGDMRTGVQQSMVEEAIAAAFAQPLELVRRAMLYSGDLGRVARAARAASLEDIRMTLFHALGFMLASPVETAEEAFERLLPQVIERELSSDVAEAELEQQAERTLYVEDKFDGMRAQIHCGDHEQPRRVAIYSRNREDITASFPELERSFANFPVRCIFDGEVLGWDHAAERALPFATFSNRLGRKIVSEDLLRSTPVAFMAFDIMLLGDDLLLDSPLRVRRQKLEHAAELHRQSGANTATQAAQTRPHNALFAWEPEVEPLPASPLLLSKLSRPATVEQLEAEFLAARERGNEGLMVKDPESLYTPGRRGLAWLKIKRELATLDVVITGAEFGHGKRAGTLSDYTFAIRDGERLRNVGKAYSGLTDAEIAHLSAWCMEHTLEDFGHFRTVEPEIVLEVAFNNVMRSTRHDSGFALRFPRIVRIRTDKPLAEIDTLERVEEVYQSQPDRPSESTG